ncbi:MAG: cobaltochelatase subunit CobN [Verrucomicrobiales bacterium]|nr:cobaltochelatase subunit CobN [Verrucomicrobiales bacterium]
MHWVRGEPGGVDFERDLVLLEHQPAEVVFLSAADTELACAEVHFSPEIRLAHAVPLRQPVAADAYVEEVLPKCDLVVMRLLGGRAYYPALMDAIERGREWGSKTRYLLLSGSAVFDEELAELSDFETDQVTAIFRLFVEGGGENFVIINEVLPALLGDSTVEIPDPVVMEEYGLYRCFKTKTAEPHLRVWILFYRALYQADDLAVIDALGCSLIEKGMQVQAFYSSTLRSSSARQYLLDQQQRPDVILTMQSFSIAGEASEGADFFEQLACPVLQVPTSGMAVADWCEVNAAMIPSEVAIHVALPELDGRVMATVAGFKEEQGELRDGDAYVTRRLIPHAKQVDFITDLARSWARLRKVAVADKRVVILLSNYPNRDGRIGNGVGLDTPASTVNLLKAMRVSGYQIDPMPKDGEELMAWLQEGVTNDKGKNHDRPVFQSLSGAAVKAETQALPEQRRKEVLESWGETGAEALAIPGLPLGNVFVGIQPQRGFGEQSQAIYHSPTLPPTPEYLAFYRWIRESFSADAVIQLGKHGNLEWLPGRNVGLGEDDFPQICMGSLPLLYPFIVNNPGEGSQAKRRNSAVIIDHLTPPLARAGLYDDLQKVERLLEELSQASALYPKREKELCLAIEEVLKNASWRKEIPREQDDDEIGALDNFLCEIKESQIRTGLHILGENPSGERLREFVISLLRTSSANRRGLFEVLNGGTVDWESLSSTVRDELYQRAELWADEMIAGRESESDLAKLTQEVLLPNLARCENEISALLHGLEGGFISPGPAGAPTRGRLDVLPTGRNFYSLDPRAIPTETAWACGKMMADALLERHRQEHGEYPKNVALVIWGTSNMRTGGDDLAQALWLWGCEPVWDESSGRVVDFEIIPVNLLGRPRVDVLLRVSGFFRDAFGESMKLLATVPKRLAELDEPADLNPLRESYLNDLREWQQLGFDESQAKERACLRVFSSPPGAYGAGLLPLIDSGDWESREDLAAVFCRWGNHAYDAAGESSEQEDYLRRRLKKIEVVHQNQDNREHDILDSDDYFQFHGGLHAAIESLRGEAPATYHGDSSLPDQPKVRTLREEFVRVVRSRVLNPKWIEAMRRHGYKGAFEMAATIDYLFGYDATTDVADSHHYEEIANRLLLDATQQEFFRRHNPRALEESVERMLEASDRGLWDDADENTLQKLRDVHYSLQSSLE